jgi:hypothetical protein
MPTNAEILDIPLLTLDGRLARGVEHRIHIIGPVLTSDESGLAAASLGSLVTSDNVSYVRRDSLRISGSFTPGRAN